MNYSDLNNPSVVSGGGAFAEYILPTDNSMITTNWNHCFDKRFSRWSKRMDDRNRN